MCLNPTAMAAPTLCSSLPPTVLTGLRFRNMNCPNWTSCLVDDCKLRRKVSAPYRCPAIPGAQTFLPRSPGLPWVGFGALSQMYFWGGMPPLSGVPACLDLARPGRSGLRAGACWGLLPAAPWGGPGPLRSVGPGSRGLCPPCPSCLAAS